MRRGTRGSGAPRSSMRPWSLALGPRTFQCSCREVKAKFKKLMRKNQVAVFPLTKSIWSSLSCWLASRSICRVTFAPFFPTFFLSSRRLTNSSRSYSIRYSIFSRYFSLFKILCSSLSEEVAAVWGRCAIAYALPFIISFNISCYSFETGCCDPNGALEFPGAPQDVMGLA